MPGFPILLIDVYHLVTQYLVAFSQQTVAVIQTEFLLLSVEFLYSLHIYFSGGAYVVACIEN